MGVIIPSPGKQWTGTMAAYRCVLLTPNGEVKAIEEIFAITKWRALTKARRLLKESLPTCAAFELWSGDKMVRREPPEPDPKPTA